MKIAHFSPLPPQQSGIATYCAALLPRLAELAQVTAYVEQATTLSLEPAVAVRPLLDFLHSPQRRYRYDVCLYHMGNHPLYHENIYQLLLRYPGIVILHEADLRAFHWNRQRGGADRAGYLREMGYAYGLEGLSQAREIMAGHWPLLEMERPLCNRITAASLGVIVHTSYAQELVLAETTSARVTTVPLAALPPTTPARNETTPDFLAELPPDSVILASFGYMAPTKRIEVVLQALARLRTECPNVRYLLVGQPVVGYDPTPLIDALGLRDIVHLTGYVDETTFRAYLAATDIGINLRTGPTGGEMSATLNDLLRHGKTTVVSRVGGFAGLPDNCVIKIDQGEDEVDELLTVLRRLIHEPASRREYGEAARHYVAEELSFTQTAQRYLAFVAEVLGKSRLPVQDHR
jgi:glycosyltransferase involved in cell wall biosynthesis